MNTVLIHYLKNQIAINDDWARRLVYPLLIGGKRVRSMLLYVIGKMLNCPYPAIEELCCFLELLHSYSLVHDDLPAMDNDCFRRGFPTAHKMFSEADAILIGDSLLTESFALLSSSHHIPPLPKIALIQALAKAAGAQELIMGQWLDISNGCADIESLISLHQKKTGALFGFALSAPAILLNNHLLIDKLKILGLKLGLAFQIQDDLLDVQYNPGLGKTAGKDLKLKKKTFFTLLGSELSQNMLDDLYKEIYQEVNLSFNNSSLLISLIQQLQERKF